MKPETCYVVPEAWEGKRLDLFLASEDKEHSRGYFQKLLHRQLIKINNRTPKASYLVKAGDQVMVSQQTLSLLPKPENTALDIVYEDEAILVLNKPANMVVHPVKDGATGTLVQAVLYHNMSIAEALYDTNSLVSQMRPGIVHRLDKDTSGLLVVAKTKEALHALSAQFKAHTVTKEYTALVFGSITADTTVHTNLKRKANERKNIMGVIGDEEEGREAITHIEPLLNYYLPGTDHEVTLISCKIETGRTHQIRVHCKHIGHPVLGDPLYTSKTAKEVSRKIGATRQLLHATRLVITHPSTGKTMEFNAPLPEDLARILTTLEST